MQKGGMKSPGLYFIFYSSLDHDFSKIFNIEFNEIKDKWNFEKHYELKKIQYEPYHKTFRPLMSLDEILTLFFKGFYVKNNKNKIYKNVMNTTITQRLRKTFLSDNYIIKNVLESIDKKININLRLKSSIIKLEEKIKKIEKIDLNRKNYILFIQKKFESLIIDNDKHNENKIKRIKNDRILFFKKTIYIFNSKIKDYNKIMSIYSDNFNNKLMNNSMILDNDIIEKEEDKFNIKINNIKKENNKFLNTINFLRKKYNTNIDSYFIVKLNFITLILYHKIINNDLLYKFNKIPINITLSNINILNNIRLNQDLSNLKIKIPIRILIFILGFGFFIFSMIANMNVTLGALGVWEDTNTVPDTNPRPLFAPRSYYPIKSRNYTKSTLQKKCECIYDKK
jgi:hypothetical protein